MAKNGAQNGRRSNGTYVKGTNGGAGGQPGRSGRKPIEFKAECARIALEELPRIAEYLAKHKPDDAGYRWAYDRMSDYGLGKPTQVVTHQGDADQPIEVSVEHRQELARRVDRIAARFAPQAIPGDADRN